MLTSAISKFKNPPTAVALRFIRPNGQSSSVKTVRADGKLIGLLAKEESSANGGNFRLEEIDTNRLIAEQNLLPAAQDRTGQGFVLSDKFRIDPQSVQPVEDIASSQALQRAKDDQALKTWRQALKPDAERANVEKSWREAHKALTAEGKIPSPASSFVRNSPLSQTSQKKSSEAVWANARQSGLIPNQQVEAGVGTPGGEVQTSKSSRVNAGLARAAILNSAQAA